MKSSVLKADETLANKLLNDFLQMNEKPEVKMAEVEFRKKDLTKDLGGEPVKKGSFEIRITKMKDGKRVDKPIFTFLKKNSGNVIHWDEKFVTI